MSHSKAALSAAPLVATNLTVLDDSLGLDWRGDVTFQGKIYRPLDPSYYAWLRSKMVQAKAACDRGKLSATAFDALRTRFNALHDQALALFGESALLDSVERLDPKAYAAPGQVSATEVVNPAEIPKAVGETRRAAPSPASRCSQGLPGIPAAEAPAQSIVQPGATRSRGNRPFSFPEQTTPDLPFDRPVTAEALGEVDAIREQAMALGWTEAELYQTRGRFAFPCGNQYGLVTFLDREHHVGPVNVHAIDILCRSGAIQRMYRR